MGRGRVKETKRKGGSRRKKEYVVATTYHNDK